MGIRVGDDETKISVKGSCAGRESSGKEKNFAGSNALHIAGVGKRVGRIGLTG